MNFAQDCLDKARFFSRKARSFESGDRTEFRYFLETAIVWARSVTFLMKKQYDSVPQFLSFYEQQKGELFNDSLSKFFLEQRNYVLKEGPVSLRKVVFASLHAVARVEGSLEIRVIRGSWRSRIRHFLPDIIWTVRQRIAGVKKRLPQRSHKPTPKDVGITERLYFSQAPWDKEPALDVFDRYLDCLQVLIKKVAERFGEPNMPWQPKDSQIR